MNPQQSSTCSEHDTYTAAPLRTKSSGPLSQPTESVSSHPRTLLEPGWAGEGFPSCSSLCLLRPKDGEVVGLGELSLSPSPHPQLQPTSLSISSSSTLPGVRVSFLREQRSPKPPFWATRLLMGWGVPQASSPSTLTLTSLRTNDTLSALQPREVSLLVSAIAPLPLVSWLPTAVCSMPSLRPPGDRSGPCPC